jgi:hypothetical protein
MAQTPQIWLVCCNNRPVGFPIPFEKCRLAHQARSGDFSVILKEDYEKVRLDEWLKENT